MDADDRLADLAQDGIQSVQPGDVLFRLFTLGYIVEIDRETFPGRIGPRLHPNAEQRRKGFERYRRLLPDGPAILRIEGRIACGGRYIPETPADQFLPASLPKTPGFRLDLGEPPFSAEGEKFVIDTFERVFKFLL